MANPVQGDSTAPGVPGVRGDSTQFNGVLGESTAIGHSGVAGVHDTGDGPGVFGRSQLNDGVLGESKATGHAGVAGFNDEGSGAGVFGRSRRGDGVFAESTELRGVIGTSKATGHAGVAGVNDDGNGPGVFGRSGKHDGVQGFTKHRDRHGVVGTNDTAEVGGSGGGVLGQSTRRSGVVGLSSQGNGVHGRGPTGGLFEGGTVAGVHAISQGTCPGIIARGSGAGDDFAGVFEGNVRVNKSVTTTDVLILGADCAEDFETMSSADIEPGTVMAIGDDARLVESDRAYDKRVAGIVSGAGDYKPGIVLGKDASRKDRVPLALIGRVFCKIDATQAPIEVGDLLTTSPTQGHAMKAEDPLKAFGAVIGKALAPLREGRGLLPILVALQ